MSDKKHDINDDEIRIISSSKPSSRRYQEDRSSDIGSLPSDSSGNPDPEFGSYPDDENYDNLCFEDELSSMSPVQPPNSRSRHWINIVACVVVCVLVALLVGWMISDFGDNEDPVVVIESTDSTVGESNGGSDIVTDTIAPVAGGYVEVCDTTVGNVPLLVITPVNATPRLHIGTDALNDSDIVLAVQAADVRGDNGDIVGAYVIEGQLKSKGQSKSGFCAIIAGMPTIGVADSTPYLEQALESEGYFFRQYPLVVANQIVENKPKGKALRKALAELNGKIVVVIGRKRQTFHEFSQTLVDLGATNAIYLVGSLAYGNARDIDGNLIEFGKVSDNAPENTNYLIWK